MAAAPYDLRRRWDRTPEAVSLPGKEEGPRRLSARAARDAGAASREVRGRERSPALTSAASPPGGRARERAPPPARESAQPQAGRPQTPRKQRGGDGEPRAGGGHVARDPGGRGARRPGPGPGRGRGRGRGLTGRRGPQDARAGSAASAAPPPGATAPPRRGSGRGGRCPGSSAPGSVAPAPPRAPAAAGSAGALAAAPAWGRAFARGPDPGRVRSSWPDRSLTVTLRSGSPANVRRAPAAARPDQDGAPAAPRAGAILGQEAPRACAGPPADPGRALREPRVRAGFPALSLKLTQFPRKPSRAPAATAGPGGDGGGHRGPAGQQPT